MESSPVLSFDKSDLDVLLEANYDLINSHLITAFNSDSLEKVSIVENALLEVINIFTQAREMSNDLDEHSKIHWLILDSQDALKSLGEYKDFLLAHPQ